jgi:hypothetical protein
MSCVILCVVLSCVLCYLVCCVILCVVLSCVLCYLMCCVILCLCVVLSCVLCYLVFVLYYFVMCCVVLYAGEQWAHSITNRIILQYKVR